MTLASDVDAVTKLRATTSTPISRDVFCRTTASGTRWQRWLVGVPLSPGTASPAALRPPLHLLHKRSLVFAVRWVTPEEQPELLRRLGRLFPALTRGDKAGQRPGREGRGTAAVLGAGDFSEAARPRPGVVPGAPLRGSAPQLAPAAGSVTGSQTLPSLP